LAGAAYDGVLLTRFDLLFMRELTEVDVDWSTVNIVAVLEVVLLYCVHAYKRVMLYCCIASICIAPMPIHVSCWILVLLLLYVLFIFLFYLFRLSLQVPGVVDDNLYLFGGQLLPAFQKAFESYVHAAEPQALFSNGATQQLSNGDTTALSQAAL
jgi:hypothetical protein